MIVYLNNWIFFITSLVVYLIILNFSFNYCGFFRYVNSLSFVHKIAHKINSLKLFAGIKNFNGKYFIPSFLIVYEKILFPLIHFIAKAIYTVSDRLITFTAATEKQISEILKEGFELLCLLTRKSINAEYKTVWPAILAVIVLIYAILTNV